VVPTRHERTRAPDALPGVDVVEADIHDDAALRAWWPGTMP
jgi:hypothetical protein